MDNSVIEEIEISELEDRIEFGICGGGDDGGGDDGGGGAGGGSVGDPCPRCAPK